MVSQSCPSDDLLRSYAAGGVGDAVLDAVSVHLSSCSDCVARLDQLTVVHDPLSIGLRQVGQVGAPKPVSAVRSGTVLREYRLVEKLGEGGMGTVFKALHSRLGKTVAIKVIRGCRRSSADAIARFEREMQAVGRLDHPNIVRATDAGEADGIQFLVMEYVNGVNLSDLVKARGPFPRSEACRLVCDAAVGLAHAHSHGLVHRDVKPSNLIYTMDGSVKVLDLGLALLPADDVLDSVLAAAGTGSGGSSLTETGTVVGTQHYIAPEQLRNSHTVDGRADVYGLGATLWYLLTGSPPPNSVPETGSVPGDLPREVWARLLARDPEDRYPSAESVVEALTPFANEPPRPRRRLWLVAAAVVAVVGTTLAMTRPWASPSTANPVPAPVPVAIELAPAPRTVIPAGLIPMTRAESVALRDKCKDFLRVPPEVTDDLGMRFAFIPPGELGLSGECRVRITRPYYLGVSEVTIGEFRQFVTAEKYRTTAETNGRGGSLFALDRVRHDLLVDPKYLWHSPGYPVVSDARPVTQVSWHDAVAYCAWRTKQTGIVHRLPTEAEWVWGARAGTPKWEGVRADKALADRVIWYMGNTQQPQPVRSLEPSPWGLYDVFGNVTEWCHDADSLMPSGTYVDWRGPKGPQAPDALHVTHGIAYVHPTALLLYRQLMPGDAAKSYVGFRVLRELQ